MKGAGTDVVRQWVQAINAHDAGGLAELMTEDHEFTDGLGARVVGRAAMVEGWVAYFSQVPDYLIEIEDQLVSGDVVGLFGWASGTCAVEGNLPAANRWRIPAAWRALARQGRIARWQVFCDNQPVYRIMARSGSG
jgi:uncharacterized protein (TIGR02246 family)